MADYIPGVDVRNLFGGVGQWAGGVLRDLSGLSQGEGVGTQWARATGREHEQNVYKNALNDAVSKQRKQAKSDGGQRNTGAYTGYGGGGGAGAGAQESAEEAAYWDDQAGLLERLLQSSNTQLGQGVQRIGDSYNKQVNRTGQEKARAQRDYGIKRSDTTDQKLGALRDVDSNARTTNDSLRRLLGLAGAGRSSAAQIVAPTAVSREATQNRTEVTDTFGRNLRNIDLAEEDALAQFKNVLADLVEQKREQERELRSGTASAQQDLYQQIGDAKAQAAAARGGGYEEARAARAPYMQQIEARQDQLDSLFGRYRNPTFQQKAVNLQTPDLGDYATRELTLGGQAPGAQPGADYQAYLPFLREREERRAF